MYDEKRDKHDATRDANRDPITGAPGSHPVGTGLGAAAGGIATGAAVGAVVGGLAGKAIGEAVDPTAEDAYWEKTYSKESYYKAGLSYDDYAPAYRTGYQGHARNAGRKFDDVEHDLEASYNSSRGSSRLGWEEAKHASRAAWNRVEKAIPGDSHRDGR